MQKVAQRTISNFSIFMFSKLTSILLALFFYIAASAQSLERRVALIVGNSNYKNAPLKNPVNDARDMSVKLRGLGFAVI